MFTSPTSPTSTISTPIIQSESKWSRLIHKRVFGDMHHAEVKLRHYEKAKKLEKISHLFWQNSCFYSVASKQMGDFFKKFCLFQKNWTLNILPFICKSKTGCKMWYGMIGDRNLKTNVCLSKHLFVVFPSSHFCLFGLVITFLNI